MTLTPQEIYQASIEAADDRYRSLCLEGPLQKEYQAHMQVMKDMQELVKQENAPAIAIREAAYAEAKQILKNSTEISPRWIVVTGEAISIIANTKEEAISNAKEWYSKKHEYDEDSYPYFECIAVGKQIEPMPNHLINDDYFMRSAYCLGYEMNKPNLEIIDNYIMKEI